MPLNFAPDERLAHLYTRNAFASASAQLEREGHPAIVVNSGDRSYDLQVSIFLARYVRAGQQGGRRVYDFQWWNGVLYARVSAAGRVAPPSRSAPHIRGAAADLAYPYNNRNTAAHARLVRIAPSYALDWTGRHFAEDWHFEKQGDVGPIDSASGAPAGAGSSPIPLPLDAEGGIGMPILFNGVSNPGQYYIAEYDGRTLKCRPTLGVEAKLLLGAVPKIPRGQLKDAEVVELCRQGGYEFKNGRPVYS